MERIILNQILLGARLLSRRFANVLGNFLLSEGFTWNLKPLNTDEKITILFSFSFLNLYLFLVRCYFDSSEVLSVILRNSLTTARTPFFGWANNKHLSQTLISNNLQFTILQKTLTRLLIS